MNPDPTPRGISSGPPRPRGPGCPGPGAGRGGVKRRKNSAIGSSDSGDWGRAAAFGSRFSTVRMFTTAGPTFSTRSAKSGSPRTLADNAGADCAWLRTSALEVEAAPVRPSGGFVEEAAGACARPGRDVKAASTTPASAGPSDRGALALRRTRFIKSTMRITSKMG